VVPAAQAGNDDVEPAQAFELSLQAGNAGLVLVGADHEVQPLKRPGIRAQLGLQVFFFGFIPDHGHDPVALRQAVPDKAGSYGPGGAADYDVFHG
jgi:hypothetical protein